MFVLGPSRVLLFYLAAGTYTHRLCSALALTAHVEWSSGLVANVSHLAYATEIRPRIMAPNTHHFQIYKMYSLNCTFPTPHVELTLSAVCILSFFVFFKIRSRAGRSRHVGISDGPPCARSGALSRDSHPWVSYPQQNDHIFKPATSHLGVGRHDHCTIYPQPSTAQSTGRCGGVGRGGAPVSPLRSGIKYCALESSGRRPHRPYLRPLPAPPLWPSLSSPRAPRAPPRPIL